MMSPTRLNRRRFLGCSAAAGLSLAGAPNASAHTVETRVGIGVIGLGSRGTTLLRTLCTLPQANIAAVADLEPKHLRRAQGIVEKAGRNRPPAYEDYRALLADPKVGAVVVALPCDLHAQVNLDTIRLGKHLYAEKPLALAISECDAIASESKRNPNVVLHIGHQRRSHPRFVAGTFALQSGRFGELIEARASWTSSNGPIRGHNGWLGSRDRSGDWMVEQGVHVWDSLHWIAGALPTRAYGAGRTGLFAASDPDRDVTDWYSAQLEWKSGFRASMTQSWIDPADEAFTGVSLKVLGTEGGFDFASGVGTFRDRSRSRDSIQPGVVDDTHAALANFLDTVSGSHSSPPPIGLAEAREAVITGLMVRQAVDEKRWVDRAEIDTGVRG